MLKEERFQDSPRTSERVRDMWPRLQSARETYHIAASGCVLIRIRRFALHNDMGTNISYFKAGAQVPIGNFSNSPMCN